MTYFSNANRKTSKSAVRIFPVCFFANIFAFARCQMQTNFLIWAFVTPITRLANITFIHKPYARKGDFFIQLRRKETFLEGGENGPKVLATIRLLAHFAAIAGINTGLGVERS